MHVYALPALAGLLAGMLVNYLADILPIRRRLAHPLCLHCRQPHPVWNYLLWPRACPHCNKRRPLRAWVVEAAGALAAVWLVHSPAASQRLGVFWGGAVLIYFGVIVIIDLEHRLILHSTSLAGAALGLLAGWALNGLGPTLVGGAVGFGVMFGLYVFGHWIVELLARRRGQPVNETPLGFGDVYLTGVLGLLLGWPTILVALFLSVFAGGAVGLVLMLAKIISRQYQAFALAIPYGPFLILGAFLMLYLPTFTQDLLTAFFTYLWG